MEHEIGQRRFDPWWKDPEFWVPFGTVILFVAFVCLWAWSMATNV